MQSWWEMNYWLMKSEPSVYGIDDLARDGVEIWDGVRNYQARNYLTQMRVGDLAFFYHSNAKPPGIAGLMRIVRENVVDPSQFNHESRYFDPRATAEKPRWFTVEVRYLAHASRYLPLELLRRSFTPAQLPLLQRGSRLSVSPIADETARELLKQAGLQEPRA